MQKKIYSGTAIIKGLNPSLLRRRLQKQGIQTIVGKKAVKCDIDTQSRPLWEQSSNYIISALDQNPKTISEVRDVQWISLYGERNMKWCQTLC